jgi:hypothetical protein
MLDQRAIYVISLAGVALDALGGIYLAYDLFGGERGTLRTLTKAVTSQPEFCGPIAGPSGI